MSIIGSDEPKNNFRMYKFSNIKELTFYFELRSEIYKHCVMSGCKVVSECGEIEMHGPETDICFRIQLNQDEVIEHLIVQFLRVYNIAVSVNCKTNQRSMISFPVTLNTYDRTYKLHCPCGLSCSKIFYPRTESIAYYDKNGPIRHKISLKSFETKVTILTNIRPQFNDDGLIINFFTVWLLTDREKPS